MDPGGRSVPDGDGDPAISVGEGVSGTDAGGTEWALSCPIFYLYKMSKTLKKGNEP